MRLLMVGPWSAVAMRRHIDWAVEGGIEVCLADLRTPPAIMRPSGYRVVDLLPQRVKTNHQIEARKSSQRALATAALRLQHVAAEFQPHVIHSYMLKGQTDVCIRSGLQPLVVSAWGFLNRFLTSEATIEDRRWLRRLRQSAHTLLVENPNLQRVLDGRPLAPLQIECFPIGVDGSLFHPGYEEKVAAWRFALNIPPDAIVLLSPRGWGRVYGQQHIMRAFASAYQRLGRPMVLVLMGMGRMKRPERLGQEVHDLGVNLGIGHAIRWIPQVPYEDMPGVYALADLVVNYPYSDAFPSTLLEAAACGRPVITSDLPAYRNTFVERFCRLVEPENPDALAGALVEMAAGEPTAWVTNVQAARQAVLDDYKESAQKERLLSLYQQVAANRVWPSARGI
ncbi:MAG: glycosyltransferase family 4 protein [Anaerolineae bacterium]